MWGTEEAVGEATSSDGTRAVYPIPYTLPAGGFRLVVSAVAISSVTPRLYTVGTQLTIRVVLAFTPTKGVISPATARAQRGLCCKTRSFIRRKLYFCFVGSMVLKS